MQPFNFEVAQDASSALATHHLSSRARFIAGGTTLVDLMKLHVEEPDLLVDISGLPLQEISEQGDSFMIGAMVSNSDLAHHANVQKHFPVLSDALLSGASPQLRNLATTGGNLLQRTRCAYFRDPMCACNKRQPGSGCGAMDGLNRMHAILGTSAQCIASHPSDMCVALMALDARIHIQGLGGPRVVPITEFYKEPGETPHIETVLQTDELITHVEIKKQDALPRATYVKVRDRASYAFALTSAAVMLETTGGTIRKARVALGGVGTIPWRARAAEAALTGAKASTALYAAAATAELKGANPRVHNQYKIRLASETLIRALEQIGGES